MERRKYLALTGSALAAATGCTSTNPGAQTTETKTPTETTATTTATPTTTEQTATETTTETSTPDPPQFNLAKITAPNTAEIGEQVSYSFTVENTGGQTGVFETTIRTRTGNNPWSESDPWREEIPPGTTAQLQSQPFTQPYLASVDFEITAFDTQFSIQFVSAKQAWGSPYTVQSMYRLIADNLRFTDSYTWTSEDYEYEETPSDGNKWAWITFNAKNVSNSSTFLPMKTNIALISGNSQYDYTVSYKEGGYQGGQVQPDIVRKGDILYEVPQQVPKDSITAVYTKTTYNGDISVIWGNTN